LDELKSAPDDLKNARKDLEKAQKDARPKKEVSHLEQKIKDLNEKMKDLPQKMKDLEVNIEKLKKELEEKKPAIIKKIELQCALFFASIGESILTRWDLFGLNEFAQYRQLNLANSIDFCAMFLKRAKATIEQRRQAHLDNIKTLRVQTWHGRVLFEATRN
jgi:predicted RNase H-like nuclease (RuvC/YqgF family)